MKRKAKSRRNAHAEAWDRVKSQLFGVVCEVTRKKPWGFRRDRSDIINKTVGEFLKENKRYDTVILHILSGEGESKENILKCLEVACANAIKVVVLEHNPLSNDFNNLPELDYIENFIESKGEAYIFEEWGRNLFYALSTLAPLSLPQLSDEYLENNINTAWDTGHMQGICKNNLVYTHTSEEPIGFKIPNKVIWVIGGGIAYESMNEGDVLIDSTLKQCIYAAKLYGGEEWKLDRLYKFKPINEAKSTWPPRWRKVKMNGNNPSIIRHISLAELEAMNENIYVSTVDERYWNHLSKNNTILVGMRRRGRADRIILKRPRLLWNKY